jgi:phage antirepressor YoqD-like protein
MKKILLLLAFASMSANAQKTSKIQNLEIRCEFWYNGTGLINAKILNKDYSINGRTFLKITLENKEVIVLRNLNLPDTGKSLNCEFFTTKKEQKLLENNKTECITFILGDGQSFKFVGNVKLFNEI